MKTKKITAVLLAGSMVLGATGCDALSFLDKSADEITEVADTYMDELSSNKYEKAAKSVKDEEDGFAALELDEDHQAVLDALVATTEYEISDAEGKKGESGKCTITITTADMEACLENAASSSAEDVIAAIEDSEDTVDEDITLKFVSDDDEWVIKDASDIVDYYADQVADLDFSSLTEESAIEYMTEVFESADGDVDLAASLWSSTSMDESLDEYIEESGLPENYTALLSAMYDTISYELTAGEVTEDYIDINASYNMTDATIAMADAIDDEFIAEVYACSVFTSSDNIDAVRQSVQESFIDTAIEIFPSVTDTVEGSATYRVTMNDDGELQYEVLSISDMDVAMDDIDLSEIASDPMEYVEPALDFALENGLCTQEEYDAYMAQLTGETEQGDAAGNTITTITEGDDFYRVEWYSDADETTSCESYSANSAGIYFKIRTWAYYDAGTTMTCTISVGDQQVYTETYTNPEDSNDTAHFAYTPTGNLQAAVYTVSVTGYDGTLLAEYEINVAE